jgi:very-short-patch-repair endonuclease
MDNKTNIPQKIQLYVEKLKKRATRAEISLLRPLEALCEKEGIPLTFQHPIEIADYKWAVIDFLLDERIALELDGKHHYENGSLSRRDKDRDTRLKQMGIKVIRVSNKVALDDPISFCLVIVDKILKSKGRERTITRFQLTEMVERKLYQDIGLPFL